jgi:Tfp pilus assembly protein PilX
MKRRGSAYLLVLGASLIITVIGLSVLTLAQISGRVLNQRNDTTECEALAQAALEYAATAINNSSNWRLTYQNGYMPPAVNLGRGTITFKITDTSGSATFSTTDNTQPVKIWGIARIGTTARILSCTYAAKPIPLDVLKTTVHTGANFSAPGLATIYTTGGPMSSNSTLSVGLLGALNGDAQALVVTGLLGTVTGHVTQLTTPLTMPPSTTYSTWYQYGTDIMWNAIPSGTIQNCLLSATSNPYGPVNPYGVYRINVPAGQTLQITSCRAVATLVINLGASAQLQTTGQFLLQPPQQNFPTLIVNAGAGTVSLQGSSLALSESSSNVNFNPAGTPYNGTSNATTTDSYPTQIQGLVHIIGTTASVNLGSNLVLVGTLISDAALSPSGGFSATWSNTIYSTPPLGFTTLGPLVPTPGTYRREQDN